MQTDNQQEIKNFGFIVHFDGDESVGIFNQRWDIIGEFDFLSMDDQKAFKAKIVEAFELCSDTPIWIESVEEFAERKAEEKKALNNNEEAEKEPEHTHFTEASTKRNA